MNVVVTIHGGARTHVKNVDVVRVGRSGELNLERLVSEDQDSAPWGSEYEPIHVIAAGRWLDLTQTSGE